VALGAVHGIRASIAPPMLAAIGPEMSKGPDDKPGCSWLGLAPQNELAGGKGLKSRTMHPRHRAAHAFRMAAHSVLRAAGAVGALYRRVTGRRGPAQARVATAHTSARPVDHMRKERVPSHDSGAAE
jgi:hypothetical protein